MGTMDESGKVGWEEGKQVLVVGDNNATADTLAQMSQKTVGRPALYQSITR